MTPYEIAEAVLSGDFRPEVQPPATETAAIDCTRLEPKICEGSPQCNVTFLRPIGSDQKVCPRCARWRRS